MQVRRHPEQFLPRLERVLARPRTFEPERSRILIQRLLAMPTDHVRAAAEQVLAEFGPRHRRLAAVLESHYALAMPHLPAESSPDLWQRLLIGAYFTMEYSIEAAAFFNPSIVPAPFQRDCPPGAMRVCFSFRAVGEGHVSSLVFREALLFADGRLEPGEQGRFVDAPESIDFPAHALSDLDLSALPKTLAETVLGRLPDPFSYALLKQVVDELRGHDSTPERHHQLEQLLGSVEDVYTLHFSLDTHLSERVIFPVVDHERNGIEDARFVMFRDENGSQRYYSTYTAYDGRRIQPRLLETTDFRHFRSLGLTGPGAVNKNLALFPRKINGRYAMLSRIDGVNNFIMFSDKLTHWETPELLSEPVELWELGNSGNCGSPLETDAGWLVITHGVGPMRKYVLGAQLLDLDDPRKVIGKLREPLLLPEPSEREGYVPNVVYSCGSLIHNGRVIIPYGISDRLGGVMSVNLNELLAELQKP